MLGKSLIKAAAGNAGAAVETDPNFSDTTLLLQADDVNDGSQNNTFLDSSTNNHTITRNGNVTQGSFSPFSQDEGKWGVYFDTSGDWLEFTKTNDFELDGDFTFEAWYYYTGSIGAFPSIFSVSNSANTGFCQISHNRILIRGSAANADVIDYSGYSLPVNSWSHLAVTRSGSTVRFFINGVQEATSTSSFIISTTSSSGFIGKRVSSAGTGYSFGYINNLRLVKGTAVYTANFTPPTEPLTAISGTSLLTCQSNRFVDNSSNAHAITVNGDPEVTPFSPFAPSTAYDPATKGGSAKFADSDSVYLSATSDDFAFGTGSFTVEGWYYKTSNSNTDTIVGTRTSASDTTGWSFVHNTSNYLGLYTSAYQVQSSVAVPLNQWYHFAITYDGTTLRLFRDGEILDTGTQAQTLSKNVLYIGATSATTQPASGYLSGLKIVKGEAIYTSAFTPPTAPPDPTGTSLCLNFTNAGIYDGTGRNVLETVGDAQVDTAVKKYGTGSMQFDGTGDVVYVSSNSELCAFGTGDFTIEMWFYLSSFAHTYNAIYDSRPVSTQGAYPHISIQDNGKIYYYVDSAERIASSTGVITTGQWYHVAVSRSGASTKMFIDGTQIGSTYSDSNTYLNSAGRPAIGAEGFNASPNDTINGYIDDLRITKGVARYTANFTPPAAKLPNL